MLSLMLRSSLLLVLLLLAPLAVPSGAAAGPGSWAKDPIYVYYPPGDCAAEWVELEVWDRKRARWRRHPVHRRVRHGTCQIEDAGWLLNELRWRCVEPAHVKPPAPWIIGLDVFDPQVMQRCAVDNALGIDRIAFRLRSPGPGDTVTAPAFEVEVDGSVWLDGMEGDTYDVLIGLDRSEAPRGSERLAQQIAAARAWIDALAPRLGKVRIGLYSYPNMPPQGRGQATGARPEQRLSGEATTLHRALDRVARRRTSGIQTFGAALDYGIERLGSPLEGGGARPGARRVLVLGIDAAGSAAGFPPEARDALRERLARAQEAGIAVHLYALGDVAEPVPAEFEELFEATETRFIRVTKDALAAPFLSDLPLPYVERVELANTSVGGDPQLADTEPHGPFRGTLPVQPGPNRAWARATLSDGSTREHAWSFVFDMSNARAAWLAEERKRMEEVRQRKQLELRGQAPSPTPEPPEPATP